MDGIALTSKMEADRIALRGVRVHAHLAALGQKTTVEQTFVNLEDHSIEALYTFPLPAGAAVCRFELVTGDRVLTGQVEESAKAEDVYDEVVSRGHGAFLLERNRPDIFTINVGNLKPKQAVTVRLTYVAELEARDSTIRLTFPTTVAPRYVTATGMDPLEAMIDGERINPPHALHVPYGLAFDLDLDLGMPVRSIESPSHALRIVRHEDGKARVSLDAGITELDRDIVLQIGLGNEPRPRAQSDKGPGDHTFVAVTIQPQFDDVDEGPAAPAEIFFVLDCSGSMEGDSIAQSRRALELCLRSMSEGDRFNICRFGSSFEMMNAEWLTYSQKTLDESIQYVRFLRADLGGTELHAPLKAVFESPGAPASFRQIILLTDGQVGNEQAIFDLARTHKQNHRIFTFGIGHACSTHLVRGLARATGGAAEFVSEGERIEEKVLRTFSRLSSPMATDLEVDWGDAEVLSASLDPPPLFEGDSITILGRVIGKTPSRCRVKITTPAGRTEWSVSIPEPSSKDGVIPALWARGRIQYLEDAGQGGQILSRANRRPNKELVRVSKEFGILCSQTSFIALEHRSTLERNTGQPALRYVPVQLPRGWGGLGSDYFCASIASRLGRTRGPSRRRGFRCASASDLRDLSTDAFINDKPSVPDFGDPMLEILAAQQADGAFGWQESLNGLKERERVQLTALRAEWASVLGIPVRSPVMDTLVVLIFLLTKWANRMPLSYRAYQKAVQFIVQHLNRPKSEVEQLITDFKRAL